MPNKKRMHKLLIHVTENEFKQISDEAEKTGLSMAEVVRRLIDQAYENKNSPILNS